MAKRKLKEAVPDGEPPVDVWKNELSQLEQEYRREFFAEGQVFYFYKRHQITQMWSKPSVEITESDYILPLPNTEYNPNK